MLKPDPTHVLHESMSDGSLMHAYVDGDSGAFDTLYDRHEGALYRFVRRLLGVRLVNEVDEVFQETWFRISDERENFTLQKSDWCAWAFAIARSLALERLRLDGSEVVFHAHAEDRGEDLVLDLFQSRPPAGQGDEAAFWYAAGLRLLRCLDELPGEQRAAFLLHNEDGLAADALTDALGTDGHALSDRLHRGMHKLHAGMERYLKVLEKWSTSDQDDKNWLPPDGSMLEAALKEALAQAPDRAMLPDWPVRQAILARAGAAIPVPEALLVAGSAPPVPGALAQHGKERGKGKGWLALQRHHIVFLALLLGALVLLIWQRASIFGVHSNRRPAPAVTAAPEAGTSVAVDQPAVGGFGSEPVPVNEAMASGAATPPTPQRGTEMMQDGAPTEAVTSPAAPVVRASLADFTSLSQWTHLRLTDEGGTVWRVPRASVGELDALLGLMAATTAESSGSAQPLATSPQWRVALEKKKNVLAVLEVGQQQVRWTEGQLPPVTGALSAGSMGALHAALRQASPKKATQTATQPKRRAVKGVPVAKTPKPVEPVQPSMRFEPLPRRTTPVQQHWPASY